MLIAQLYAAFKIVLLNHIIAYSANTETDKMEFIAIFHLQHNLNSFVIHIQHFAFSAASGRLTYTTRRCNTGGERTIRGPL